MNNSPIYMIMVFEKIKDDHGLIDLGDRDVIGYFHEFSKAEEIVLNNCCDINETIYDYAVIETIYPGIYKYDNSRSFYKYNLNGDSYKKINEPDLLKKILGFSLRTK